MVIHDQEQQARWTEERTVREQEKQAPPKRSGRWSVLAVQSLACGLVVALALLLRVAGGAAYEELRQGFQDALMRNELMSVLSRLWDGEVLLEEEEGAESDVKGDTLTDEEPAQLMAFSRSLMPYYNDA